MKIYTEQSLADFKFWSGAETTAQRINKAERALTNLKRFWKIYIPTESMKRT